MNDSCIRSTAASLVDAMEALWALPDSARQELTTTRVYSKLLDDLTLHCSEVRKCGAGIAIFGALAGLGLPCNLPASKKHLSISAGEAAARLKSALEATSFTRFHLLPLDLADDLPTIHFGSATIGPLTTDQLRHLVDHDRLERIHSETSFHLHQFSQFQWLVVQEEVPIARGADGRELFRFHFDLLEDFGRIEPHRGKYPEIVDTALFWLALAPWEQWAQGRYADWRGLQIPWAYTVDHDLFSIMKRPPSSDTLTWAEQTASEGGHPVEVLRPVKMWLPDDAGEGLTNYFKAKLGAIAHLPKLQLLQTPVAHFLTRAFLTSGIDEFMAHLLAIEAALGLPNDYKRKSSSGAKTHESFSGADRVAARLAALLDVGAASEYQLLYKLRSQFLHGRMMQAISTAERLTARSLARRAVDALVTKNHANQTLERNGYLDDLLAQGALVIAAQGQGD